MRTREQKKAKPTGQSATTSESKLLQTRPFDSGAQSEMYSSVQRSTADLDTQFEEVKGSGYNLLNLPANAPGTAPPQPPQPSLLQAKLTVGTAGDEYEKEADAAADRVVSTQEKDEQLQTKPLASTITPVIDMVQQQENSSGNNASETANNEDKIDTNLWLHAANLAETKGMANAANHIRHYIDNPKTPATVLVNQIFQEDAELQSRMTREMQMVSTISDKFAQQNQLAELLIKNLQ